jgi:hypothetical protein
MTTKIPINRVLGGVPAGGEFATHDRHESNVVLERQGLQFGGYVDVERHDYLDRTYTESVNKASGFTDSDFSALTDNYLVSAIWSSTNDTDDEGRELDQDYDISNFTEQSRERARTDLHRFLTDNRALVSTALATDAYGTDETGTIGALGHDFWLTRNGHGAGFWDRDALDSETRDGLTEAAQTAGTIDITVLNDTEIEFV